MNKTILMGRLTKDPEVKYLQDENSTAMARYTLAVDRRYRKDGKAETDFISCVTFGKNAEFAEKYLKKGLKILVSGRIQTGSYVNQEGTQEADTYSARPGCSEHQTGLALDINTASLSDHFEETEEYAWLVENSWRYGFILRFPEGKEEITGYQFEPWHYRYVGPAAARVCYENGWTLEEYHARQPAPDR